MKTKELKVNVKKNANRKKGKNTNSKENKRLEK